MPFSPLAEDEKEAGVGSSSSSPFLLITTPAGRELGIGLPHFQPLSRFQTLAELHCCREQEDCRREHLCPLGPADDSLR